MDLSFHAAPQRWTVSQFLGGFGATVDWWLHRGQPADPRRRRRMKSLYQHLNAVLAESAPGSHGLLFTPLSGPSQLPGAAPGGTLAGLQLAHTRADMARAILEGCAFEVRWALDQLRGSGLPATPTVDRRRASASPLAADPGRHQRRADRAGGLRQLGRAGRRGVGRLGRRPLPDAGGGHRPAPTPGSPRQPDAALGELYSERYAAYRHLASALTSASATGLP